MVFKPGEITNPNGRPKGSQNKLTQRAKYYAGKLFDEFEKIGIDKIAQTAEVKDLINLISKFLPSNVKIDPDSEITININKKVISGKDS